MNPVASQAQRQKTLRNIRHAERALLPPGWDDGLEHQFGSSLTNPLTSSEVKQTTMPKAPAAPEPMPAHSHIDHRARRIVWKLITLWCIAWILGPLGWWLFS